jgi:lipoyl synthase
VNKPKIRLPNSDQQLKTAELLSSQGVVTVCQEANCPNIHTCFSQKTATFMLLGDTCTRHCRFCAVKTGNPMRVVDGKEPQKVAKSVQQMGLKYVVLTSVDRDDLDDLGANQFILTIQAIREIDATIQVEILTPDFMGRSELIASLLNANPTVFAHNIETVERLTPLLRDRRSSYRSSLDLLSEVRRLSPEIMTKSSMMLGLGESDQEVMQALIDLKEASCQMVTLGQYLAPTTKHHPVHSYLEGEQFKKWEHQAYKLGFKFVAAGPLVRSSYRAAELFVEGHLS